MFIYFVYVENCVWKMHVRVHVNLLALFTSESED